MLETWIHVGMLFGTGVMFGVAVGGGAMFKSVDGRPVERPFPGERHFRAAGALFALVFALQFALTLTGTVRGPGLWTLWAVTLAAAVVISITGRQQATRAMRERHAEELQVLEHNHPST